MATATANGVRLHYEIHGTAEIPLVLVHGSWGSHRHWDTVVSALATSFRVLTYDRRGHGDSEVPAGQGSVRDDVDDLALLIEGLGLAPVYLAGNSFGAAIGLRLAGERHDMLRGVIAHEPPLFALLRGEPSAAPALASVVEAVGAVVQRIEAGDHEEAASTFMAMALAPGEWTAVPPEFRRIAIENAPTFLDEAKDPEALDFELARLQDFSKPLLLTFGEKSPPQYAHVVRKLTEAAPHAELMTFPESGHLPHVTHPDVYVDAVTTFISKLEAS